MMQNTLFAHEGRLVAGIDEVGRGPLAGPVVAGAVILDINKPIAGLADSKALSHQRRVELAEEITGKALAWSVAWADAAEVDSLNILQATLLAMRRAILGLRIRPANVEVDGNRLPNLEFDGFAIEGSAVVGGDSLIPAISAASIIAKVRRDRMMVQFDQVYPTYGFRRHKGYGTAEHRECLSRFGPCPQHRRSFRPLAGAGENT
jgi:ribonuclease HII